MGIRPPCCFSKKVFELYWIYALLFLSSGFVIVRLILPSLLELLMQAQFLRPNYRGELIPAGAGLVFLLASFFICSAYFYLFQDGQSTLIILFAVAVFTCLGLIDDVLGTRETSGLGGHLQSFFRGHFTTGALKAAGGLAAAALMAALLGPWPLIPVNTLIISLSANAINLLDLRPGRAGKGFLILAVIFLCAGWSQPKILFLISFLGCVLAYLKVDLKARAMMGDTGANPLGALLGVGAIWALAEPYRIAYLILLIFFHFLTEKYSLSRLIARNRILDYLDRLGR